MDWRGEDHCLICQLQGKRGFLSLDLAAHSLGVIVRTMNIITLIPSATEIVSCLGLMDRLVGTSHECDWPETLPNLPKLTAPKLDITATSADIDRSVKSLIEDALGVYHVDADKMKALAPDIIITQDQCEVCAVSAGELDKALHDWTGGKPQVISLSPQNLDDILDDIQRVAALLGVPERGIAFLLDAQKRMVAVKEKAAQAETRPTMVFLEWIEPMMAGGNWMPELADIANADALLAKAGAHSPYMDMEALANADPDVIVVTPCGFGLERTAKEIEPLLADKDFQALKAMQNGRVYLADGNHYFNRPGPRIVDSLECLSEMLHPELFEARMKGSAWRTV